ncbi:glycine cleavage system protein H [archaeon 13_1_20CM_2_54_9]|nr:MAG: glycine cleavage system protein H [Crenarchaeota archaeon 13_1_40CM_3_53_5]OLE75089.1 MAG: glycine cleavage system protein H [archaeon 13_1_20CM_2_54_9]
MKGEYSVPDGLYYTKEHEWVRIEENKCRVGVTDYAQNSLHEIVYVDLPKVGTKVAQMQSLGTVESVKAVADVYSPVSGEVVEVNNTLSDAPELVNKTPYSEGWITVIKPEDLKKDLPGLMRPEDYRSLLKKITEKK